MSGNFTVTATTTFLTDGNPHRKASIMLRKDLDVNSAFLHFAIHGDGMPSVQFRPVKDDTVQTLDIVVRQSLDTDATYADVVVHGNGMPSLQWRARKGEDTNTLDLPVDSPGTFNIRLVRTGVRIFMYVGKGSTEPKEIVHTEVTFQPNAPVLVGLAVCSHDPAVSETAVFSNVKIE